MLCWTPYVMMKKKNTLVVYFTANFYLYMSLTSEHCVILILIYDKMFDFHIIKKTSNKLFSLFKDKSTFCLSSPYIKNKDENIRRKAF